MYLLLELFQTLRGSFELFSRLNDGGVFPFFDGGGGGGGGGGS